MSGKNLSQCLVPRESLRKLTIHLLINIGSKDQGYIFFWLHTQHAGVPQTGIEPVPPTVEARSLNHWTTREVPRIHLEIKVRLVNTTDTAGHPDLLLIVSLDYLLLIVPVLQGH